MDDLKDGFGGPKQKHQQQHQQQYQQTTIKQTKRITFNTLDEYISSISLTKKGLTCFLFFFVCC